MSGTETRRRSYQLGVRLLPDEHARLMTVAKRTGRSRQEALVKPFAQDHDQHHPWGPLEAALVLTLIDWDMKSKERPPFGEGSDRSDLMNTALTRIKGLCSGVLDPDAVMKEIEDE